MDVSRSDGPPLINIEIGHIVEAVAVDGPVAGDVETVPAVGDLHGERTADGGRAARGQAAVHGELAREVPGALEGLSQ